MHGRRVVCMGGGWHTWEEVGHVGGGWLHHCHHCSSLACHHHCCHLQVAATAPYVPLATALYMPPPPPEFTSHHCPTLGAPTSHPLPPCASHPCPRFSGPTTVYLCTLPRPTPRPPPHASHPPWPHLRNLAPHQHVSGWLSMPHPRQGWCTNEGDGTQQGDSTRKRGQHTKEGMACKRGDGT